MSITNDNLIFKALLFFLRPKYDKIMFGNPDSSSSENKTGKLARFSDRTPEEQECIELYEDLTAALSVEELYKEKEKKDREEGIRKTIEEMKKEREK